ncbi:MAG TPA: 2'-deoxycytidine 5'-triphosphate deaminase [Alphaproteobacteria bacterium]|nr:2'-deoxycytidine 5'-triphosphate deaminase [Alphaproteobacteria bacterium]
MSDGGSSSMLFPDSDNSSPATSGAVKVGTGVLPYQHIAAMIRAHEISAVPEIDAGQLQPSSLDLRLGRVAYRVRASFLPGPDATVMDKVGEMGGHPIDLAQSPVLERNAVYVVPLLERVKLPSNITGFANPKSSTGRIDVLTRLITDRSMAFDQIERGYEGPLYVEIAPQTFSIVAREGSRLNQVRFQRHGANLSSSELQNLYDRGQLVRADHMRLPIRDGLVPVTIDLKGNGVGSVIGYRAKKHTDKIDVDRVGGYDPYDYWERIEYHRNASLILDPGEFYILATCEEVGVPPHLAAEMVPYYTRSGEYRVHYAGFFDPGFGWNERATGSRAVLEVRSHDVPFMLEHGQTVAWLRYDRMAAAPSRVYGVHIKSNYQNQGLALAKHFQPFGR